MFSIKYLWETGLMQHWIKKYMPIGSDECLKDDKKTAGNVPLKLVDLLSAFLILVIGIVLSFFVFLLEIIHFKMNKRFSNPLELRN